MKLRMFIYVLRKKAVPWSFWYMALSLPKSYLFLFFPTFPYVLSHVWLFATPWTVACQAPLSMGFSRQEYWNRLPFPYTITLFWSQMDIWYRVNRLKCQTFWNYNAFSNFCARLRNSFNTNLFFFFFFILFFLWIEFPLNWKETPCTKRSRAQKGDLCLTIYTDI